MHSAKCASPNKYSETYTYSREAQHIHINTCKNVTHGCHTLLLSYIHVMHTCMHACSPSIHIIITSKEDLETCQTMHSSRKIVGHVKSKKVLQHFKPCMHQGRSWNMQKRACVKEDLTKQGRSNYTFIKEDLVTCQTMHSSKKIVQHIIHQGRSFNMSTQEFILVQFMHAFSCSWIRR